MRWVGGQKRPILFVYVQGKKYPHLGGQVVKKGQSYVLLVIERPIRSQVFFEYKHKNQSIS